MTQMRAFIENDLILVNVHGKPGFFSRIEKIVPDVKKKWWQVTLLILQVPVHKVTWTIDDNQIRGQEFTMGGVPIRLDIVDIPEDDTPIDTETTGPVSETADKTAKTPQPAKKTPPTKARILSFPAKKETN